MANKALKLQHLILVFLKKTLTFKTAKQHCKRTISKTLLVLLVKTVEGARDQPRRYES